MSPDNTAIKLLINTKKVKRKTLWKNKDRLLNNQLIIDELKMMFIKYLYNL